VVPCLTFKTFFRVGKRSSVQVSLSKCWSLCLNETDENFLPPIFFAENADLEACQCGHLTKTLSNLKSPKSITGMLKIPFITPRRFSCTQRHPKKFSKHTTLLDKSIKLFAQSIKCFVRVETSIFSSHQCPHL